jgi:hypothetical protein
MVMQSEEVTLDGGDSTTISFEVTPNTLGEHAVNIGGLLAVFEVKELTSPVAEETSNTGTRLSNINIIPIYEDSTGTLISARIDYRIDNAEELGPEAELTLKVLFEGELLEEIPPLSLNHLQSEGNIGSLNYIPLMGWETGLYTFEAELYEGEGLTQKTELGHLQATPESTAKVVSWYVLGLVIGIMLVASIITVAFVLHRRRDMLRDYTDD